MARQRYSKKEALNRILKILIGSAPTSEVPGAVMGEMLSEDEAISDLAELLADSLPNEALYLPDFGVGDMTVTGDLTVQNDIEVTDDVRVGDGLTVDDYLYVGTGTLYARDSQVSIGGFEHSSYFGGGRIVLGFGPASTPPTGSLAHLGGVLFAQGGALKWLGSSGTVTTLAGS